MELWESTIQDLYQSAVDAFPNTGLRQHATQPVVIKNLQWIPYLGMKTLYIKGLAQNEGREYRPMINFRQVNYNDRKNSVKFYASDNMPYEIEKISLTENDITVRCDCPDFRFRFAYYNFLDSSLYGRKPQKYIRKTENFPPANPSGLPGMCKHLIKLQEVLQKAKIFKD